MSEAVKTIRVGDALVERGLVSEDQVAEAVAIQKSGGRKKLLGEILVELGYVTQQQLSAALADAYGIPFVNLTAKLADARLLTVLPRDFIEERCVLPLFKVDGTLTVAVTEPSNFFLIEEISQLGGCPVQIVAALEQDIRKTLDQLAPDEALFDLEAMFKEADQQSAEKKSTDTTRADIEQMGGDSPVVQLVNHAVHSAIREGASDVHFEPDEGAFRIRYRVDGALVEKLHPPTQMQAAIIARIKVMAGMDISERRLPQDGAIRLTSRGKPVDLRVSTMPNKYGEKAVIRIIDNSNALLTLDGLSLADDVRRRMEYMCRQPYGLVLVTGPTGSGKSTTLYSMLNAINNESVNICTCEDPIEFNIKGINQFQVHEKIGLTFASMLRTLLRQDPDVIMVGEIRDPETARIAVQAALTGHLVLSTLHTNDSAGAITRLQNLSLEPYLISAALVGVIAQRLVRCVCPECKTTDQPNELAQKAAQRASMTLSTVIRGRGCSQCNQKGLRGRTGLYEVLIPSDEMRNAIALGANLGVLREHATRAGTCSLFDYGMKKVQEHVTTVDEVLRVTTG